MIDSDDRPAYLGRAQPRGDGEVLVMVNVVEID
jgi:hypothetical protein